MRPKDGIHYGLECRRRVAQPKRHHQIFIVSVVSAKCRFVNVKWIYSYLVITGR